MGYALGRLRLSKSARVSIAAQGDFNIPGSGGWILNRALAIKLATEYGDRVLRFIFNEIERGEFFWDMNVPKVLRWIEGVKSIRLWEMNSFSPADPDLCQWQEGNFVSENPPMPCIRTHECDCSRTSRPATWHLEGNGYKLVVMQIGRIPFPP